MHMLHEGWLLGLWSPDLARQTLQETLQELVDLASSAMRRLAYNYYDSGLCKGAGCSYLACVDTGLNHFHCFFRC